MAVYSTFFVAAPEALLSGFPGWKLPLDKPVKRQITDFFGESRTIETREPLWEDVTPGEEPAPEYGVVAIEEIMLHTLKRDFPRSFAKHPIGVPKA